MSKMNLFVTFPTEMLMIFDLDFIMATCIIAISLDPPLNILFLCVPPLKIYTEHI